MLGEEEFAETLLRCRRCGQGHCGGDRVSVLTSMPGFPGGPSGPGAPGSPLTPFEREEVEEK